MAIGRRKAKSTSGRRAAVLIRPIPSFPVKDLEMLEPARVLVVDDSPMVRKALVRQLEAHGYTVEAAGDGPAALELLAGGRFDAVLLDVEMPGMSGLTVLERIRKDKRAVQLPVLMVTANSDTGLVVEALGKGASDYLIKPPSFPVLLARLSNLIARYRAELENRRLREGLAQEVLRQTKELLDTISRLERTEMRIRRSQEETIYRLARAAEFRDNETGRHLQRMSHYSALLARKTGLPHERCELIRVASPMHDIGKIGIPDNILYKNGKHTPDEFQVMKQHAEMGYTILKGSHSELLDTAAMIAWTHHEKFDGSGYPRGLAGEAIPFEGRVVAIADVFDALTSKRVYKPAFSVEKSQEIMNDGVGKHFDPSLLDLFWANMPEAMEIRERYSDPAEPEPLLKPLPAVTT
jgi:putative two-component system response regulator